MLHVYQDQKLWAYNGLYRTQVFPVVSVADVCAVFSMSDIHHQLAIADIHKIRDVLGAKAVIVAATIKASMDLRKYFQCICDR